MEYVRINGNLETIQPVLSVKGLRQDGTILVTGNTAQLYAFCTEAVVEMLQQKGLVVDIMRNNAHINRLLISQLRNKRQAGDPVFVHVQFSGDIRELEKWGFKVQNYIGNVASGTISPEDLDCLLVHPAVIRLEPHQPSSLALNKSVPAILANQVWSRSGDSFSGYTGKGVIIGIIDTGIDFSHKNFRKADGTTRILSIWDQTLVKQGDEKVPDNISDPVIGNATIDYGVEYDNEFDGPGVDEKFKKIIQKSLDQEHPAIPVRHRDTDGHGSHVAGIAAGDGSQRDGCTSATAYKYIGVAPEADLVIVRMWSLTTGDENLPASIRNHKDQEAEAVMYIMNYARKKNKPVVINMSLGGFSIEMDGTSSVSQKMDSLLDQNKNALTDVNSKTASIVVAAGNAGAAGFHAKATVPKRTPSGDKLTLPFTIMPGDGKIRYIEVLYDPAVSTLAFLISNPMGQTDLTITANSPTENTVINGAGGSVKIELFSNAALLSITPGPGGNYASDQWKLFVNDLTTVTRETEIQVFFIAADPNDTTHPTFTAFVETSSTLNRQASTKNVITVGCYSQSGMAAPGPGQLAAFSGRGPTLDNLDGTNQDRLKPEICAPGVGIFSCISDHKLTMGDNCCCDSCYDFYKVDHGTSMSAPHVAGIVALMMQKNPRLEYPEIRNKVRDNNQGIPPAAPAADLKGWGKGQANAKTAVDAVTALFAEPVIRLAAPPPVQQDAWTILLERFLRNPKGEKLSGVFHQFFHEVRSLVNNNRRVATVWHRNKGSAWIKAALYAAQHPEMPIPGQLSGISLKDSLGHLKEVLKRYGSLPLKTAIEKYEPELELLYQGMSLSAIMSTVTEPVNSII